MAHIGDAAQHGHTSGASTLAAGLGADGRDMRLRACNMAVTVLSTPGSVTLAGGAMVSGYVSCEDMGVQGRANGIGGLLAPGMLQLVPRAQLEVKAGAHASEVSLGSGCDLEVGLALDAVRVSGSARRLVVRGALQATKEVDLELSGAATLHAVSAPAVRVRTLHEVMTLRESIEQMRMAQHGRLTADVVVGESVDLEHSTVLSVRGRRVRIGPGCSVIEVTYSETLEVDKSSKVEYSAQHPAVLLDLTEAEVDTFAKAAARGGGGGAAGKGRGPGDAGGDAPTLST